jgi:quercetin dioxygenase-like cupin family protein
MPKDPLSEEPPLRAIRPEEVEWRRFSAFPPEARLAVLAGNPAASGPYVVRVHLTAGGILMPHSHPEDRIYTVIAGVFCIGLGREFDESRLTAYGVGSVVILPGNRTHFHHARYGDYITQVSGQGPLGLEYVCAADDPRQQAPGIAS